MDELTCLYYRKCGGYLAATAEASHDGRRDRVQNRWRKGSRRELVDGFGLDPSQALPILRDTLCCSV
jgi:hypothetical protein